MKIYKVIRFLYICLSGFIAFSSSAQQQDSLLVQLERKWSNAKAYAIRIAERMPAEYYTYKPVPDQMSFQEQLLHTARNMQWLSSSYLLAADKFGIDEKAIRNKEDVIAVLAEAYDVAREAHRSFPAQKLDEPISFFAGPMTRRQVFFLLHDHQTHHLGQLLMYLRLKGVKPPDYVGW